MRIKITSTFDDEIGRIEGFCHIPGWRGEDSVIAITKNMGGWNMGSSMCLPSNTDAAKVVLDTYNAAFKALAEIKWQEQVGKTVDKIKEKQLAKH